MGRRVAPRARESAWRTRHEFEHYGALASERRPHAKTPLHRLEVPAVRVALLSRDSRRRVERILSRHALDFDRIASRDDPPMKPHLKGIRQSVRWLGVEIDHALTIGDYIFDIRATQAVRMRGVRLPEPDEPLPLFL